MPYDPKNYSLGPIRMEPRRVFNRNIQTANYADLERRIMLWIQTQERMTGGPANQVGDHDPDYVPGFRYKGEER